MRRPVVPLFAAVLLAGCAGDPDPAAAARTFTEFQSALQRGDAEGCRRVLTLESALALADLPWDRVAAQLPLQVLGARREGTQLRVAIADPNDGGRRSEFVVVREYGRLVVDLVASAGLHAQVVEATASTSHTIVPRELTPADLDRIRLHELAEPPR